MISYCALAILAVLLGANAQSGDPSCSKQMELEHRCMLNIETSPEAQMIKDRMKQVKKTCVPDYPEECHAEFEAAHECGVEIAKSVDTDPTFQASKSQSQPAVDACFEKYPVDIKKGIMEIFMMGKPQMHHGKHGHKMHHHKRHHNQTSSGESGASGESGENQSGESGEKKHSSESGEKKHSAESGQASSFESSSNETSGERRHHGSGKHHGGKRHHCRAHRHHRRNNTSSESNETSGERRHQEKPQCRKTKEQRQCMKEEMKKLAKDSAFVDVINTLIHQKQKCKQIITWSCSPKCEKKRKCIFQATKPCREAFMDKMKTCLAAKGFTLPPHMMKEHHHNMMFTTPIPDVTPQN